LSTDPRAGIVRRHHLSDSVIQKAVKAAAVRANIHKPISVHTLRHSLSSAPAHRAESSTSATSRRSSVAVDLGEL
jgi:integrase